jgi:acyl transferase domain-containing protein
MENYEGTLELNGSEVAVIGMACRFPGARNLDEYWRLLRFGLEGVSFLTEEELDRSSMDAALQGHPDYVKAAALLDDAELFDASFFGYTPKEAEVMDPQQRLFLELSWEALENAGYDPTSYKGAIGVYAGARTNTYLYNLFSNPDALGSLGAFEIGLGNDLAFLSARVAYKLGLRGPAYSVHTACSTGLVIFVSRGRDCIARRILQGVRRQSGWNYIRQRRRDCCLEAP